MFFKKIISYVTDYTIKKQYEKLQLQRKQQREMLRKASIKKANVEADATPPKSFSKNFAEKKQTTKEKHKQKKTHIAAETQKKKPIADATKNKSGDFKQNLIRSQKSLVYLVRGKDKGRAAWHYVLVDKTKLSVFLRKTQGGSLNVADYGKVLYSGWGQDPPEDIVAKINEEFGE